MPAIWGFIAEDEGRPGPHNMAVDQALLERVQAEGRPVLRLYRWDPPCLSFGRNEPARGCYDAERAARRGLDMVRRPTGGRAVLHDRELTYSVAIPVGVLGSPRETYRAINAALVAGLRRLGVAAEVSAPAVVAAVAARNGAGPGALRSGPCFEAAAPGEVVAAGRKLIGSAQRRDRRTLLQHGSLLLDGDQGIVTDLLRPGNAEPAMPGSPAPPPATLASLLGTVPAWPVLVGALRSGFEETLGIRLARVALADGERARARELCAWYGSAEWTWRR